jgi:hypothetical protein
VRILAGAHLADAVLARADGRLAEAERKVREVIGVGSTFMQGRMLIENLVGAVIVMQARDELVALYETSGRSAEARPIVKSLDPSQNFDPNEPGRRELTADEQNQLITNTILDPKAPMGLRWEMAVHYAAFQPCTQLRSIVFGPDPEHYDRFGKARKALVRNAGDEALMTMAERTLDKTDRVRWKPESLTSRALVPVARVVDALTGSNRMTACARLMGSD